MKRPFTLLKARGSEAAFYCFFLSVFLFFFCFYLFPFSSSSKNGLSNLESNLESKTPFRLNQIVKGEVVLRWEEVRLYFSVFFLSAFFLFGSLPFFVFLPLQTMGSLRHLLG